MREIFFLVVYLYLNLTNGFLSGWHKIFLTRDPLIIKEVEVCKIVHILGAVISKKISFMGKDIKK